MILPCLLQAQQAYRWTDDQGRTHFGDRPPAAASGVETVQLPEAPSKQRVRDALAGQQRIREQAERMAQERVERERLRLERDKLRQRESTSPPMATQPRPDRYPGYYLPPPRPYPPDRPRPPIVQPIEPPRPGPPTLKPPPKP